MTICHQQFESRPDVPGQNVRRAGSVTSTTLVTLDQAVTPKISTVQRLSSLSPLSLLKFPTLLIRAYRGLEGRFVTGDSGDGKISPFAPVRRTVANALSQLSRRGAA